MGALIAIKQEINRISKFCPVCGQVSHTVTHILHWSVIICVITKQDDDGSLAAWIKRMVRKELKQKGIEVWWPEFCIVF
ncbi:MULTISPECIES: hypothetical protein [unclassified Citrobacter]|uniref:hypothetical protein n=1 Tax=unclassified Citrobacter TaxID=2644389 RepID=UPI0014857990|nr:MULTISPECIES: hypothetical protein [unclassified Citrobacter]